MAEITQQVTDQVLQRLSNGDYLLIITAAQAKNIKNWGDLPEGTVTGGVGIVVSGTDGKGRRVTADAIAAYVQNAVNGHEPYIDTATKTWWCWDSETNAYVGSGVSCVGPTGATGPAGAKGDKGDKGDPGPNVAAPYIGENGNWYVWDDTAGAYADTGVKATGPAGVAGATGEKGDKGDTGPQGATGPRGPAGPQGPKGTTGKSAYTLAVEGGYTGTEAQFKAALASLDGAASARTYTITKSDVSPDGNGAVAFGAIVPRFTRVSGSVSVPYKSRYIPNTSGNTFCVPFSLDEDSVDIAFSNATAVGSCTYTYDYKAFDGEAVNSVSITFKIYEDRLEGFFTVDWAIDGRSGTEIIPLDGAVSFSLTFAC